ncbi:MAG: hypothetical protein ABJG78_20470 [Cyclobacteriaceae bacterium]
MKQSKVSIVLTLLAILGLNHQSFGQKQLPVWVQQQWDFVTKGEWVAPNPYESEEVPFDSYGMKFEIAPGGMALNGKLYALKNGKEVKTLWTFLNYWNPGKQKLVHLQYGNNPGLGNIAIGEESAPEDWHKSKSTTTSYKDDGTSFKAGHESEHLGNKIISNSFNIIDSEWKPRGKFIWTLKD